MFLAIYDCVDLESSNIFWRVIKTMVSRGLILCPLKVRVRLCTKKYYCRLDFIFVLFRLWSFW